MTLFASFDRTTTRRFGARFPARPAGPGCPGYATSRVHAALTALAFVLSSLFGMIHEARTTHVRCAQHGELIDGGANTANTANAANTARTAISRAQSRDAIVRDLQALAIHGHEHCALASAMRESRVVPRPPALVPVQVAIGDLAIAVPRVAVARDRDLYRTAPKTSPPV